MSEELIDAFREQACQGVGAPKSAELTREVIASVEPTVDQRTSLVELARLLALEEVRARMAARWS